MHSCAKTDLLCKGGVLYTLPAAVFIEINWQGHPVAMGSLERKREMRGEDKGRVEQRKRVLQLTADCYNNNNRNTDNNSSNSGLCISIGCKEVLHSKYKDES